MSTTETRAPTEAPSQKTADPVGKNPRITAVRMLAAGLWPVPIYPAGMTLQGRKKPTEGKEPIGKAWGAERNTLDMLAATFKNYPRAGVGVALGPGRGPEGRWLADVEGDGPEAEESRLRLFGGEVVDTLGWGSARGGHQLVTLDPDRLAELLPGLAGLEVKGGPSPGVYHLAELPGLELRLGGHKPDGSVKQLQSVMPPTVGTGGKPREWNGVATIAPAPEGLYSALRAAAGSARANGPTAPPPDDASLAADALRHLNGAFVDDYQRWLEVGMSLFSLGPIGLGLWDDWSKGSPKYSAGTCETKWKSFHPEGRGLGSLFRWATEAGWTRPRIAPATAPRGNGVVPSSTTVLEDEPINRTDLGNARRLVKRFGSNLRYCPHLGAWLIWDKGRWREDPCGGVYRFAKKTVRSIGAEAAACDDDNEAKALLRWALDSESKKRIDAMVGLAWSEPGIPLEPDQLNRDPWLLNVQNGTIDLHTGRLRPHCPEDLITKQAPVMYDPAAECPRWLKFLDRIMGGDAELIGFLQRAGGYALTGDVSEHALFFFYGTGRNGKGTFLETLLALLGDYATTVDPRLLTVNRNDDHPTGLTDLDGRRFIPTVEVEDGKRLAEALVKRLTGGDRMKARRMRQDNYEFDPTHKIFLAANHKPEIKGTDEGIWSRIKLVPFEVYIPPEERVRNLKDQLVTQEGPGILAWFVRGNQEWQRVGLKDPEVVKAYTQDYRAEMDVVGGWFAECCDSFLHDSQLRTEARELATDLYQSFVSYAKDNGIDAMPGPKFGSEMEQRGFKRKPSNGKHYRCGVRLKASPHNEGGRDRKDVD